MPQNYTTKLYCTTYTMQKEIFWLSS